MKPVSTNQQHWIATYGRLGALWIHDDNPLHPHAELTSGKHSSGFFNSELVMEDPMLLAHACGNLLIELKKAGLPDQKVDRVVGPAMGAITMAHEVARQLGRDRLSGQPRCLRAYTEKADGPDAKRMVFKRTAIKSGEVILLVEDVLTTGGSVERAIEAVLAGERVVVLPYLGVLVNRSGITEISGMQIVALIEHSMPTWDPKVGPCPLCEKGSKALRPKDVGNWALLNASC